MLSSKKCPERLDTQQKTPIGQSCSSLSVDDIPYQSKLKLIGIRFSYFQ